MSIVVLDNGAGTIKLGFAGEPQPRMVFPNCSAKAKGGRAVHVGDALNEAQDIMQLVLRRPHDRGYLVNWDLEKDIWVHALRGALGLTHPGASGLVLTEPIFNFEAAAAATQELVFEECGFGSLFAAPAPWFSLLRACADAGTVPGGSGGGGGAAPLSRAAAQARTAVIVDAGFSASTVVPFFDGQLLGAGARRVNFGGKAMGALLRELVSYRSLNVMEEPLLMEGVKEAVAFVSQDAHHDLQLANQGARSPYRLEYVLPDGVTNLRGFVRRPPAPHAAAPAAVAANTAGVGAPSRPESSGADAPGVSQQASGTRAPGVTQAEEQVLVLNNERFMVPEALFRPSDIGLAQAGLPEALVQGVSALHPSLAPLLYSHVVLTGGVAGCPGFAQRFRSELRPLVPADVELCVVDPPEPELYAWRGASMFGASPGYAAAAVTRRQYEEQGATRAAARAGASAGQEWW